MEMGDSDSNVRIPVDLFVSKKHPSNYKDGDLCFVDSDSNTVYKNGSWQCFKEGGENKELVFRVQRTKNTLRRTELGIFLAGEDSEDSIPDLTVKGFPFKRSCTVYKGNDIIAQTSLMHKLNQIFVKRGKFRLTIFPGSIDHSWIVALTVIFMNG